MSVAGRGRVPTMRDVAARAGVSRQLVSLVLRDAPGPSTASREAILQAAADLGFRANTAARLLRQDRTRLIGMIFSARNPFETRFVERLLEQAPRASYGVALAPLTGRRSTEVAVGELRGHRVEALLCFSPDPASPTLQRMITELPVVWLGERADDDRVDVVRPDDEDGLRLAIQHLTANGHQRIAYVGGLQGNAGPGRAAAYRSAMRAEGLADEIDEVPVGFDEEQGAEAARRLLARPALPTAVVTCGDQCAVGVLAVLSRAGVRVPEDVSLVGYDDSPLASYSYIRLTSVRQDVDLSVDAALAAVADRTADPDRAPRSVATPATLVVRDTTGPARRENAD